MFCSIPYAQFKPHNSHVRRAKLDANEGNLMFLLIGIRFRKMWNAGYVLGLTYTV